MDGYRFRIQHPEDAASMCDYRRRNRERFASVEPAREDDFYTLEGWRERIAARLQEQSDHRAFYFVAENSRTGDIHGHCSLTNICFGPFMAAFMGYGVDKAQEGTGLIRTLCLEVIAFAFRELHLNRISANYMPSNYKSARLLRRLGFTIEGTARAYLKINNRWEDHILTSLINPDRGL